MRAKISTPERLSHSDATGTSSVPGRILLKIYRRIQYTESVPSSSLFESYFPASDAMSVDVCAVVDVHSRHKLFRGCRPQ